MILVTGSRGFIGQHVMKLLPKADQVDLKRDSDIFELKSLDQYDAVIHLAAVTSIQRSLEDPRGTYYQNVVGVQHLLNLKPKKFVFASSGSAADPISPYAMSKLLAEDLIKQSGVDYCILRLGNVYGEGDDKSAIMHFFEDEIISINGTGNQRRSFIHVSDVARAFIRGLKRQGSFNIGHELMTINEVAALFNKTISYGPRKPGETEDYNIYWTGIKGWKPHIKIQEWIQAQI